jgi:hypothetical protein
MHYQGLELTTSTASAPLPETFLKGSTGQTNVIDWLFTVLRPAQESFTYMETSPLPVKGCKI